MYLLIIIKYIFIETYFWGQFLNNIKTRSQQMNENKHGDCLSMNLIVNVPKMGRLLKANC